MTINNPFAQSGTCMCQYCSSKTYLYNNSGNRNRFCGNCGNKLGLARSKPNGLE